MVSNWLPREYNGVGKPNWRIATTIRVNVSVFSLWRIDSSESTTIRIDRGKCTILIEGEALTSTTLQLLILAMHRLATVKMLRANLSETN